MGLEPLSLRQMESQTEDIYEAVVVMSQRARQILHNRLFERVMREGDDMDMGVFDELPEIDPEDYQERVKPTTVAVDEFMEGKLTWRKASSIEEE